VILVGAPVSLQETFKNIISRSKSLYQAKNDHVNLNYISMLENMDTSSIQYSSFCFRHAMQNGFYSPKTPTAEAKNLYALFRTDTLLTKYASQMSFEAPQGFWENEKYTTIDLTKNLQSLKKKQMKIYGLFGKDDGLFSEQQVTGLQEIIGSSNLKYLDNCSHNVFIDQQIQFIDAVMTWAK
jgi:proline iminopeptidase